MSLEHRRAKPARVSARRWAVENMKSVFLLEHSYEMSDTGEQETKTIGIYSSRYLAEQAIERLITQPGFCDFPDYFNIDEYIVDQDGWEEGFISETYEPKYSVWRQDDNGNIYLVKDRLTEVDAFSLVREYEEKGHKQSYWAKEIL
jgi:hypothetical protein